MVRFLRSAAAGIGLVGLLLGPPAAFVRFGHWPIRGLPTGEQLRRLPETILGDTAVFGVMTVAAWAVWAILAAAVLAEIAAVLRGRDARRIPLAAWAQPRIHTLVTIAFALLGSLGSFIGRAGAPPTPLPAPAPAVALVAPEPETSPASVGKVGADKARTEMQIEVSDGDDHRDVAARHPGAGGRWPARRDGDRAHTPPDAPMGLASDERHGGWALALPTDAEDFEEAPDPTDEVNRSTSDDPRRTVLAKRGDHFWELAANALEEAWGRTPTAAEIFPYWEAMIDANWERLAMADNPDLIYAGQEFVLPPLPPDPDAAAVPQGPPGLAELPTDAPVSPEPPRPPAPAMRGAEVGEMPSATPDTVTDVDDRSRAHQARDRSPGIELPVPAALGSGLLAAGIVATIGVRRRLQHHRRRNVNQTIPLPEGASAEAERGLRSAATGDRADRLDAALRVLAGCLRTCRSGEVPRIAAVSVQPEAIEILLDGPVDCDRGPFQVEAAGRAWTLPADVDPTLVERLAARHGAPAPALVTVGRHGEGEVLVDLEAAPRTVLTGDAEAVASFMWGLVAGLATSRWADELEVVVIGAHEGNTEAFERVRVVERVDDIRDELEHKAVSVTADLARAGFGSPFEARLVADTWEPTVVVLTPAAASDPGVDALWQLAGAHHGLTVVAPAPLAEPDRELRVEGGAVVVHPSGLQLCAVEPPCPVRQAVDEVLRISTLPPVDEPADANVDSDPDAPVRALPELPPGDYEVLVGVAGPPIITGGKDQPPGPQAIEAVVYLAMHPEGVDNDRFKNAVWDGRVPSQGAFNQMVSRARRSLGDGSDGVPYISRVTNGTYCTSRLVTTDFAIIEAAYKRAQAEPSEEAMGDLARALTLVRGTPFQGVDRGYRWVDDRGLRHHIEVEVTRAAHLLATWALERGDADTAHKAVDRGLLASPPCEPLHRDRMLAHDLDGNIAGVEAAMRQLAHVLGTTEPFDHVHPETLELYERLTRKQR